MEEEADSAKAEMINVRPMNTTPITSRKSKTHEERSAKGGATIPDQADKTT